MRAGPILESLSREILLEGYVVLDVIYLAGPVVLFAILVAYAGFCANL